MPRQFQFKNPFATKSEKLTGKFSYVAKEEHKREKGAYELSQISGQLKRLAKKANILITSVRRKKYKNKEKLQKEIDKINALVADLNNIRVTQCDILTQLDVQCWNPFKEVTLDDFKGCLQEE